MHIFRLLFLSIFFCCIQNSQAYTQALSSKKNSLPQWLLTLPCNNKKKHARITLGELKQAVADFSFFSEHQLSSAQWLHDKNPYFENFFHGNNSAPYIPFAQKLYVPSESKIAFFGDLHGNLESVLKILMYLKQEGYLNDQLKIIKKDFYMIFLGDYVDRGAHGVEVLYILLLLKIANQDKVFLVRGNHEDRLLNTVYGFKNELLSKFPSLGHEELDAIFRCYDFMPTVLFVGSGFHNDFIQCCHGGLEIGYCAKELLKFSPEIAFEALTQINRIESVRELPSGIKQDVLKKIPQKEIVDFVPAQPTHPLTLGFMWNDFIENSKNYSSAVVDYSNGRGWVFGKQLTALMLAKNSSKNAHIRAIFRAHQHHGGMLQLLQQEKGIVKLWDGLVHTFLTASLPNIDFNYTSLGILTTADQYCNWSLEHIVL